MNKVTTMMKLAKLLGPALVIGGVVLLYFGYQTSQGVASQVGEVFSGRPSDDAMGFYIGGGVCVLLGLGAGGFGFLKKS